MFLNQNKLQKSVILDSRHDQCFFSLQNAINCNGLSIPSVFLVFLHNREGIFSNQGCSALINSKLRPVEKFCTHFSMRSPLCPISPHHRPMCVFSRDGSYNKLLALTEYNASWSKSTISHKFLHKCLHLQFIIYFWKLTLIECYLFQPVKSMKVPIPHGSHRYASR